MDCTQPEFWEKRYQAGSTPWDCHGVPSALLDFLRRTSPAGSVFIPGCGSGYEAKAFHDFGWRPDAVDFSPAAVKRAHDLLGPLSSTVRVADFFKDETKAPYDLVYERTFLCSLPPERWPDYAARIAGLLRPNGVLAGLFYYGVDPDGPPFPLAPRQGKALFERFELLTDLAVPNSQSVPLFAGHERWQEWRLKPWPR